MRAAGGSPMAFAVPAGETVPMVLDFGTMHDLYADSPHVPELFSLAPGWSFAAWGWASCARPRRLSGWCAAR